MLCYIAPCVPPQWSHCKQEPVRVGCQDTVMPSVDLGMDKSGKIKMISTEISPGSTNLIQIPCEYSHVFYLVHNKGSRMIKTIFNIRGQLFTLTQVRSFSPQFESETV